MLRRDVDGRNRSGHDDEDLPDRTTRPPPATGPANAESIWCRALTETDAGIAVEPQRSFALGSAPPFDEERVYRGVRPPGSQTSRDCLSLADDFVDRPDADLAPGELDYDVTAMIETQHLPKPSRYEHATRL